MMIGREKNLDFERSKKHKQPAENKNRNQQDFWKKNHVQKKHAYESQNLFEFNEGNPSQRYC